MIVDPLKDLPTLEDVEDAARRLRGVCVRTPLLRSDELDARIGAKVWIKPEMLQRTGSFKMRGAWNRICRIPEEARRRGVVAYSSGNHAQGVAESARLLGVPAWIVMPEDSPRAKIESTAARGAHIRLYDRIRESREAIAEELLQASGATLIRPFDDGWVMAGQGTAALEACMDLREAGATVASFICSASGGGLLAGCASALAELAPDARSFGAEPSGHDDLVRSLASGRRETNPPGVRSIADALMAPSPGELTFEVHQRHGVGAFSVEDDDLKAAMSLVFRTLRLVCEPGGAAGLAAVMRNAAYFAARGETLVILSGGNVDPTTFTEALQSS
ncbi:MAG: threonine/serine dehydratase [Alphaproteobacteria bacterium]|nr:threonine/serine dehydratase [Alphaproteobacteria bacterium]